MSQFQQEIHQMREALSTMESRHAAAVTEAKLRERQENYDQIKRLQQSLDKAEKRAVVVEEKNHLLNAQWESERRRTLDLHEARMASMRAEVHAASTGTTRTVSMVDMEKLDSALRERGYIKEFRDSVAKAVRESLHTITEEELARDVLFPQWQLSTPWGKQDPGTRRVILDRAQQILSWLASKADPKPEPKVEKAPVVVNLPAPTPDHLGDDWAMGYNGGKDMERAKIKAALLRQGFTVTEGAQ